MKVAQLLDEFYLKNGIPEKGGMDKNTFQLKFHFFTVTLPNPSFRKKVIHVHDIEHILNECDTSWKGEAFIAGWEISTGLWKHFPICLFSITAMGYSIWFYPKTVYNGFKKGLNDVGIIDMNFTREEFLEMEFDQLQKIAKKKKETSMGLLQWITFVFWVLVSQVFLFSPFLVCILTVAFMGFLS